MNSRYWVSEYLSYFWFGITAPLLSLFKPSPAIHQPPPPHPLSHPLTPSPQHHPLPLQSSRLSQFA